MNFTTAHAKFLALPLSVAVEQVRVWLNEGLTRAEVQLLCGLKPADLDDLITGHRMPRGDGEPKCA